MRFTIKVIQQYVHLNTLSFRRLFVKVDDGTTPKNHKPHILIPACYLNNPVTASSAVTTLNPSVGVTNAPAATVVVAACPDLPKEPILPVQPLPNNQTFSQLLKDKMARYLTAKSPVSTVNPVRVYPPKAVRGRAGGGGIGLKASVNPSFIKIAGANEGSQRLLDITSGVQPNKSINLPSLSGVQPNKAIDLPSPSGVQSNNSINFPSPSGVQPNKSINLPSPSGVQPSDSVNLPSPSGVQPNNSINLPSPSGVQANKSTSLPPSMNVIAVRVAGSSQGTNSCTKYYPIRPNILRKPSPIGKLREASTKLSTPSIEKVLSGTSSEMKSLEAAQVDLSPVVMASASSQTGKTNRDRKKDCTI